MSDRLNCCLFGGDKLEAGQVSAGWIAGRGWVAVWRLGDVLRSGGLRQERQRQHCAILNGAALVITTVKIELSACTMKVQKDDEILS